MSRKEIAKQYIELLSNGDMKSVIDLFSDNGKVYSPIYGVNDAASFYQMLAEDTMNSKLAIRGIYEDSAAQELALYFEYTWTVKTGKIVKFDVVDILKFDKDDKIFELRIIYDTVLSRKLVHEIKEEVK